MALEDSLDERVQNFRSVESSGFFWWIHCMILAGTNIGIPILIVALIVEIMK